MIRRCMVDFAQIQKKAAAVPFPPRFQRFPAIPIRPCLPRPDFFAACANEIYAYGSTPPFLTSPPAFYSETSPFSTPRPTRCKDCKTDLGLELMSKLHLARPLRLLPLPHP